MPRFNQHATPEAEAASLELINNVELLAWVEKVPASNVDIAAR
jgi:hypothetical protein